MVTLMLAAAMGAGMVAFADPPARGPGYDLPPGLAKQGKVPPGHARKMWKKGEYLPLEYRGDYFDNWSRYELRSPPPGYRYVVVDSDVYLTQVATGLIAEALIDLLD
jgi:hypothetical protein